MVFLSPIHKYGARSPLRCSTARTHKLPKNQALKHVYSDQRPLTSRIGCRLATLRITPDPDLFPSGAHRDAQASLLPEGLRATLRPSEPRTFLRGYAAAVKALIAPVLRIRNDRGSDNAKRSPMSGNKVSPATWVLTGIRRSLRFE